VNWTVVALSLGTMVMGSVLIMSVMSSFVEHRKNKLALGQQDALRELVHRYEELSQNILDGRQRTASDVSDLRSRITSIERSRRAVG